MALTPWPPLSSLRPHPNPLTLPSQTDQNPSLWKRENDNLVTREKKTVSLESEERFLVYVFLWSEYVVCVVVKRGRENESGEGKTLENGQR
ncbi:hypothetical protein COLO4_15154 [Corchorus olitorius]|uniref:Uncharacterized protein n=1 Tax=Corchorus olitorius TaxID=93759 RepID=A0A1R3JP72_9ROSI|nr:hypothetical protein COLO4_15154 [Corchorus olitorius]